MPEPDARLNCDGVFGPAKWTQGAGLGHNHRMNTDEMQQEFEDGQPAVVNEDRLWCDNGWTARVIKNEDDEGWAVSMTKDGESEPALVGPWTMGRDKKNPKPLDASAFQVLVKTASEVIRRHEHHLHAMLHKKVTVDTASGRINVMLDIVPDEYEPYALLSAQDPFGEVLAEIPVEPGFKLTTSSAQAWIEDDFRSPG